MPRSFPPEFKKEAVRLYKALQDEQSMASLARDLGVHKSYLSRWVKIADREEAEKDSEVTKDQKEIRKLRRRIEILEEQNVILKKAAAFLAEETDLNSKRHSGSSSERRRTTQ